MLGYVWQGASFNHARVGKVRVELISRLVGKGTFGVVLLLHWYMWYGLVAGSRCEASW